MRDVAFTVIIPAHNEEAVIARCLETLLDGAPDGASDDPSHDNAMQIIVAANGCTDRTAERARRTAPDATVLELSEGSKPKALNAGSARARHPVRLFIDADVQCSYSSARALAMALCEPGVMAASPAIRLDLARSSALVRAYYRVWLALPYATDRLVGSGCFGLSEAAVESLGPFPEIIGDDIWIRSQFAHSERRNISQDEDGRPVYFVVSPPRTLLDQVRVESRRRIGNAQVDALLSQTSQSEHERTTHGVADLLAAREKGASWMDLGVYAAAKLAVIARVKWSAWRGTSHQWERDLAAREA